MILQVTLGIFRVAGLLALVVLALCRSTPAWSAPGKNRPAVSGRKQLLLFAKDPATWHIVKGGGSGKLVFSEASGAFTLTAAGLQPRTGYALVRVVEAPAGAQVVAKGTSDPSGKLELTGVWHTWSKKFWLVAGEDVAGVVGGAASLKAWRPARYLFEEKPLGVPCDCPELEEP